MEPQEELSPLSERFKSFEERIEKQVREAITATLLNATQSTSTPHVSHLPDNRPPIRPIEADNSLIIPPPQPPPVSTNTATPSPSSIPTTAPSEATSQATFQGPIPYTPNILAIRTLDFSDLYGSKAEGRLRTFFSEIEFLIPQENKRKEAALCRVDPEVHLAIRNEITDNPTIILNSAFDILGIYIGTPQLAFGYNSLLVLQC